MRSLFRALSCAPLALFVCACGGSSPPPEPPGPPVQPFPEAMNLFCNVDKLANLSADEDLFAMGQRRTAWLTEHIDNPDAIEFRTLVSVKGPDEQAKVIRAKAKEAGVEPCPLADAIESSPEGGLAP